MRKAAALLLALLAPHPAWACPSGCGDYDIYFVVVTSGFDRDAVLERGKALAGPLESRFVSTPDDPNVYSMQDRLKSCGDDRARCLLFATSDDSEIGKQSWTVDELYADPGALQRKTYAVVYLFDSYETKANKKQATRLLNRVRKTVPDAYLKSVHQCACE